MNTWPWSLGQNTITVALMLPFVLLACRLFRNRPAVQNVLWVVVLLKFVTPPIVSWPWTVEQLREVVWTSPAPGSEDQETVPLAVSTHSGPANVTGLPDSDPSLTTTSVHPEPTAGTIPKPEESGDTPFPDPATNWASISVHLITGIWLLGAVLCGIRQMHRIACHAAFVRRGTTAPVELTAEIKAAANRLEMRPPKSVIARGIVSPFVWCLGGLRLVWPESLGNATAIARSRGIIAHELAHVRRCDHWVAWLDLLAGIIWWWNPLFWFVRRRLRETAEMACDALAIAASPGERREYAELLLELSAGFKNGAPAPVLAVGAGTASSFERRLAMILSDRVSAKMSSFGLLATLGFALLALPHWSLGQPAPLPDQNSEANSDSPPSSSDKHGARGKKLQPGTEEKLEWGEPVNGLRLALAWPPTLGEPAAGETPDLYLAVQNVSTKQVRLCTTAEARNKRRVTITTDGVPQSRTEIDEPSGMDVTLEPQEAVFLRLFPEQGPDQPTRGTLIAAGVKYTPTRTLLADMEIKNAPEGAWTGMLTTPNTRAGIGAEAAANAPRKQENEMEPFTAWGTEINGLQAGLGFRPGEKRAYRHGETVNLVVRIRNVGKEEIEFQYLQEFFKENPPIVTEADGKPLPGYKILYTPLIHVPKDVKLAAGEETELSSEQYQLMPTSERGKGHSGRFLALWVGTGKIGVDYKRLFGNTSAGRIKIDPDLLDLATGTLELEVMADVPAASKVPDVPKD